MKLAITALVVGILIVGVIFTFYALSKNPDNNLWYTAEVYYSPTCGCCVNYIGHLRDKGINVKAIVTTDTDSIKNQLNIPQNMRSCHTTKIEGYFVEGHIPVEAIQKLVAEKPKIDGIAMPGMPSGSPGMPGIKQAPFDVYGIINGQSQGIYTKV